MLYLRKYAPEAVAYFLEPRRLHSPAYFPRFLDILRSEAGRPLLLQMAQCEERLLRLPQVVPPPAAGAAATDAGARLLGLHWGVAAALDHRGCRLHPWPGWPGRPAPAHQPPPSHPPPAGAGSAYQAQFQAGLTCWPAWPSSCPTGCPRAPPSTRRCSRAGATPTGALRRCCCCGPSFPRPSGPLSPFLLPCCAQRQLPAASTRPQLRCNHSMPACRPTSSPPHLPPSTHPQAGAPGPRVWADQAAADGEPPLGALPAHLHRRAPRRAAPAVRALLGLHGGRRCWAACLSLGMRACLCRPRGMPLPAAARRPGLVAV